MSLRVQFEERAFSQATTFLDDPAGLSALLEAVDNLIEDPRPDTSFPYGSADLRRLRVGRYRVLYEIRGDVISVAHIARGPSPG